MEDYDLRLVIIEGEPNFVEDHTPQGAEDFTFALKWKNEQFGDRRFEQWWMDQRSIYAIRNSSPVNFDALVDFWWRACIDNGTNREVDVCQSYVLAKSLRHTRSNGARNVFADSILRRVSMDIRDEMAANLDAMLRSTIDDEMSILEFSRRTERFLSPPEYAEGVFSLKEELESELFGDIIIDLQRGSEVDVADVVSGHWEQWCQRARRRNAETVRQVVDVLSYEAKAAVHRCYSHFWMIAVYWLANVRNCSRASFVFHKFWHTDVVWPSNMFDESSFHLFHGHVLALHPGASLFVQTETGKQLIGDWLMVAPIGWQHGGDPETPELRRLLNGLSVAMLEYASRLDESRNLRRQ